MKASRCQAPGSCLAHALKEGMSDGAPVRGHVEARLYKTLKMPVRFPTRDFTCHKPLRSQGFRVVVGGDLTAVSRHLVQPSVRGASPESSRQDLQQERVHALERGDSGRLVVHKTTLSGLGRGEMGGDSHWAAARATQSLRPGEAPAYVGVSKHKPPTTLTHQGKMALINDVKVGPKQPILRPKTRHITLGNWGVYGRTHVSRL